MSQQSKRGTLKISSYFKSERFKPSGWSKYFWIFSGSVFLIGLIILCTLGFNLGLDFTGGIVMNVKAGTQIENVDTRDKVENIVNEVLIENGVTSGISRVQVVNSGENAVLQIQYQNISGKTTAEMTVVNEQIYTDLETKLTEQSIFGDVDVSSILERAETKSASASSDLLMNALLALVLAVLATLIYIGIRFDLISGLSAVITLFHDVLLMCAFVLIFRIEINAAFIAAIITVLGYSVNNTIVIFDRIRENLKKDTLAGKSNREIANLSIRQTLTRTFNTSLTTVLAVVFLAVIGVSAIKEFMIPIIIGILVGTYAAIFISAPLWASIFTNSRFDKRRANKIKTSKIDKTKVVETTAQSVID